jgi:TolB-like protein
METGKDSLEHPTLLGRMVHFLGEVGRRRVWRTVLGYAAAVFVLLQLGEIVFPAFQAPDWALRLLVVASFLGLPLVLALAWAFDITPEGIRRTEPDDAKTHLEASAGTTLPRLTLLAVTGICVLVAGWWAVEDTLEAQASVAPGMVAGMASDASPEEAPLQIRSLAVLPLDDFSPEEGGEYFTAGFHEELVSQLSQTGAARVLSRTSVVQYDATGKTMPAIAADLGVEGVVEGSVFRDGNRVRITVQLIHGPSDQHLWANSYDGTLEDAIGLQRKVARAIAREIQSELAPEEDQPVPETRVAANPQVQEEYLKGRYAQSRATTEGLESAIRHFEAAVEEDSSFAPAFAGLAGARLLLNLQKDGAVGIGKEVEAEVVEPLQVALELDRDLPEARAVLLTLQKSIGRPDSMDSEGPTWIFADSAALLEAEIALTSTELGRQLERIAIQGRVVPSEVTTSPVLMARRYMQENRREEALQALETAVARRDRHLATLWVDPVWDSIRAEPRFREILSEARKRSPRSGRSPKAPS